MARYTCPDCDTRSDKLASEAEAIRLLADHRRYFCRPRRPAQRPTASLAAATPARRR